jgi:hypothetical protein
VCGWVGDLEGLAGLCVNPFSVDVCLGLEEGLIVERGDRVLHAGVCSCGKDAEAVCVLDVRADGRSGGNGAEERLHRCSGGGVLAIW